jgi:hypothetical protein
MGAQLFSVDMSRTRPNEFSAANIRATNRRKQTTNRRKQTNKQTHRNARDCLQDIRHAVEEQFVLIHAYVKHLKMIDLIIA